MLGKLFIVFIQVGLFSFGGGYAALPIIQNQLTNVHQWMTTLEFSDVVTLSQMTPGPLSINAATFVGMKQAGLLGAIVATYALVIPSMILCGIMSYFYYKYRDLTLVKKVLRVLRGSVVALILMGGLQLVQSALFPNMSLELKESILFVGIVFLLVKFKVDSILAISIAGVLGYVMFYLMR